MQKKYINIIMVLTLLVLISILIFKKVETFNPNKQFVVGQKLDSLNGVYVYYNGGVGHVGNRNTSEDGYNIGLKYQCVEFVKRYYYEYYTHKMPDSYGNAKDFFDNTIKDKSINPKRDLIQCTNPSVLKPQIGDLIIFDGHVGNQYGHVAIISQVNTTQIEIIQQNPGPYAPSRVQFDLDSTSKGFKINHDRLLGWLRMK
jgi:surface antigen